MKALIALCSAVLLAMLLGFLALPALADEPAPASPPAQTHSNAARIKELISQGGYAFHLKDYAHALLLADEVLKLDPQNAAGLQLRQMTAEAVARNAGLTWSELRMEAQQRLLDDVRRQMTPGPAAAGVLPQGLRQARPGDEGDLLGPARQLTRENAAILSRLDKTVNVDFKDASMTQVAQFLSTAGNVNVMIDPKAALGDLKAADATVTFSARDISLLNALKWVCRSTGLYFTVRDQVVLITSKEGLEPFKVTAVYDVSDLVAPIPDFDSEVYFNMNLNAVDVRRLFDWYAQYPYWYYQDYRAGRGPLPFAGPFAVGVDSVDRVRFSQPELEDMINRLIESEDAK